MGAAVFWFSFVNIFLQVAETLLRTITVKLYYEAHYLFYFLVICELFELSLCALGALVGEFKFVAPPAIQITTRVVPF